MPDNFEQKLRNGASRVAYALAQPGHPGGSPNPPAATSTPSPNATPKHTVTVPPVPRAPAPRVPERPQHSGRRHKPAAGTTTLQLGNIVMQAPSTWRVTYNDGQGDYMVSGTSGGALEQTLTTGKLNSEG